MSRGDPKSKTAKKTPKVNTRGLLPRKKPPKVKVMSVQDLKDELRQKKLREKRRKELLRKGVWHGGKGRA